ncbi:MAG: hypothetical protein CM1200mP28_18220 [Deltaproteobacteria bacterium]|nr:MAG: hypothetical protein CM1200mP28_18220 [Deltaproteobacteria bacterium]
MVDDSPKSLKHNQIEGLRILADQIVSLIENDPKAEQSSKNETKKKEEDSQTFGKYYSSATILFADFVGFTSKVERLEPGELLATLNTFFKGFDKIVQKYKVRKVKTIGDAYMCVGGISEKPVTMLEKSAMWHWTCEFVDASNISMKCLVRNTGNANRHTFWCVDCWNFW